MSERAVFEQKGPLGPGVSAPTARRTRLKLDGAALQAIETGYNRLLVVGLLFVVAFLVVGARLVEVMALRDGAEPRLARGAEAFAIERADIVDRNGVLLATSLPTASLYANPRRVLDAEEAATKLWELFPDLDREIVLKRLTSDRAFVWIKRNLTPRQQVAVNRQGLPGLYFHRALRRVYPQGRLLAHVVGFTDIDGQGLAGIERAFDAELKQVGVGPLALAIDARFQQVISEELARSMAEFQAVSAAGMVLDARSGEVLAMVSLPDFDPHRPPKEPEARFNRASLGAYEMGSTFKVFTTAMALDSGVARLTDGYDATRPIRVARYLIRDFHPKKRWLTVPEILVYSSNIGAAKMALDVGTDRQRAFLSKLGLLQASPLELPEVASPIVPSPWREINTMTIGFGYGLAVNPVQVAAAFAAIVNGGIMRPPTLLKWANGAPSPGRRVISPETSVWMRQLLRLVVTHGTGKKAAVPGYLVGGKTGTAEKPGAGGYSALTLLSSFLAAFPIDAPRYVVLAILDEPKGTPDTFGYATGGWTAAPTVGRIIARLGPLAGIPPAGADSDALRRVLLPEGVGEELRRASF